MVRQENVTKFVFKSAQYYVSDGNGDTAVLQVDYKNNNYTIETNGLRLSQAFEQDIARIAADLLKRKHGVNFVDRVAAQEAR